MLLKNTYLHHKRHICMDRIVIVCATYRMRHVCNIHIDVVYSADRPVASGRRVRKATGYRYWIKYGLCVKINAREGGHLFYHLWILSIYVAVYDVLY